MQKRRQRRSQRETKPSDPYLHIDGTRQGFASPARIHQAIRARGVCLLAWHRESRLWLQNARLIFGEPTNFGDDYNEVIDDALRYAQACIVCNDDVVLTPTSYQRLLEDVEVIREMEVNVGWVGARSDYVRPAQNIRYNPDGDHLEMCRFKSEQFIRHVSAIAPIFAYISRDAWHHGRFPPLNWFQTM